MPITDPRDPGDIVTWRRINPRLTTSGQPREDQLAAIAAIGVRHVVNLGLHSHEKALPDEAASLRRLGLPYTHIPVDFDRPTVPDFVRFAEAMDALRDVPIHVHCIANLRVSAFLYRYRRDREGVPEAEARAEMETVWRPGGAWAAFIGDDASKGLPHRYAGRDY